MACIKNVLRDTVSVLLVLGLINEAISLESDMFNIQLMGNVSFVCDFLFYITKFVFIYYTNKSWRSMFIPAKPERRENEPREFENNWTTLYSTNAVQAKNLPLEMAIKISDSSSKENTTPGGDKNDNSALKDDCQINVTNYPNNGDNYTFFKNHNHLQEYSINTLHCCHESDVDFLYNSTSESDIDNASSVEEYETEEEISDLSDD